MAVSENSKINRKLNKATISKLRRIALERQGLLRNQHFGRGKQACLRAIEQIGYVQIDTISVVERAHHHVLWSRVANFQAKFLEQLVRERQVFEYWFHAAAWLPMRDFRFALPRMQKMHGERGWFPTGDSRLMQEIRKRIENEGPLRARDFEDEPGSSSGWWDWKPAKQALEQMFMEGELMVSGRSGFQKIYDLPERVLPPNVDTRMPDIDEYATHLIDSSLRAHGFSNLKSMAYLRKGKKLRDTIKARILDRVDSGDLTVINIDNNNYYIDPELLEARAPHSSAQANILSPFDNSIILRERGRDLFEFDYQIECYVPEAKRQFGYFCLPILYRDRFVGRLDCKAHRREGLLEVKSIHLELSVDDDFIDAIAAALSHFAKFNQCNDCQIRNPNRIALVNQIESHMQL